MAVREKLVFFSVQNFEIYWLYTKRTGPVNCTIEGLDLLHFQHTGNAAKKTQRAPERTARCTRIDFPPPVFIQS